MTDVVSPHHLHILSHTHTHVTDLYLRSVCMAGPDNGNGQMGEMRAIVSTFSFNHNLALAAIMLTSSNTGLTHNCKWNV